jgi:hypothetical protein
MGISAKRKKAGNLQTKRLPAERGRHLRAQPTRRALLRHHAAPIFIVTDNRKKVKSNLKQGGTPALFFKSQLEAD